MEPASENTVLIIEDERDVVDLLTLNLRKAGFTASTVSDGATGLEVCKILKSDPGTRQVPIMMLTAKAEEIDRILGSEFGADDHVAIAHEFHLQRR